MENECDSSLSAKITEVISLTTADNFQETIIVSARILVEVTDGLPYINLPTRATNLLFRKCEYILRGDVEYLYREILVRPEDRDFQRIVWRNDPAEGIMDYRLNTVTFGVASPPFLASCMLHEVASSIQTIQPEVAGVILQDFYTTDIITGTHELKQTHNLRRSLNEVLSTAGLPLREWASNKESMNNTVDSDRELKNQLA
ncbi:unnamed protein product [Hermetia illucens]|uniref:Reverse transcriptase domain-containing protein n=1 Tax=Hermetia illucens TaxID=343691 RepID=A0A7R8UDC6_HERIL|nr:unnamed protein product [Hermetia illucens]